MSLAMYDINNSRKYHDGNPNQRCPVRRAKVHRQVGWPASPEDYECCIQEAEAVDPDSGSTKTPTCWWKRLAFPSSEEDAADTDL